ncbi:hypothetical protein ACLKA7_015988 [Drosophila subpalustris]
MTVGLATSAATAAANATMPQQLLVDDGQPYLAKISNAFVCFTEALADNNGLSKAERTTRQSDGQRTDCIPGIP